MSEKELKLNQSANQKKTNKVNTYTNGNTTKILLNLKLAQPLWRLNMGSTHMLKKKTNTRLLKTLSYPHMRDYKSRCSSTECITASISHNGIERTIRMNEWAQLKVKPKKPDMEYRLDNSICRTKTGETCYKSGYPLGRRFNCRRA